MTDILVAKPKLPEGWTDVSVGEPHLVRDELMLQFDVADQINNLNVSSSELSYPTPSGYQPLVDMLEKKHGAPVVITNGAKQALGAVFYALAKANKNKVGMRLPYWALIPPLAHMHGLECVYDNLGDAYLCLAPNNPDGHLPDFGNLQKSCAQDLCIPLIHDAAYYTPIYLGADANLSPIGDVQIFSISKMIGLSGLRLGYAVCYNRDFYTPLRQYVEAMTVGASIFSQKLLYSIFHKMDKCPIVTKQFEASCFHQLQNNKKLCLSINPEVLEVPENILTTPGMFGWFKVGPKADFKKSKLNFIDGSLFGVPGFVRMNLAFPTAKMRQIIDSLNKSA